ARSRTVDLSGLVEGDRPFDLRSARERSRAFDAIIAAMQARRLKMQEKPRFAAAIGEWLGVDYESVARERMLTIMVPEEVRRLASRPSAIPPRPARLMTRPASTRRSRATGSRSRA